MKGEKLDDGPKVTAKPKKRKPSVATAPTAATKGSKPKKMARNRMGGARKMPAMMSDQDFGAR